MVLPVVGVRFLSLAMFAVIGHRFGWGVHFGNTHHLFVSREYRGCETVGRASKKTHMARMETTVEGIHILNKEKRMSVACVQGMNCFRRRNNSEGQRESRSN